MVFILIHHCVSVSLLIEVQDYFLWCSQAISEMSAEESISDVATAALQLAQHQQLWTQMEARRETYQLALDMAQELQVQDKSTRREVSSQTPDLIGCRSQWWCVH